MGKHPPPCDHVAYCEEADDDGEPLDGVAPKYARSVVAETPNTGRSRRESRSGEATSPIVHPSTDSSDSTAHPSKKITKMKSKDERRKSIPVVQKRPPARPAKTAPNHPVSRASDDASYYGVVPHHTVVPAGARPRAHTRPESYYGQPMRPQQRPPMAHSAYYSQPPPSQFSGPPYHPPPPPSWMGGPPMPQGPPGPPMGSMAMVHQHHPMPPPPPPGSDYFARDLSLRFKRPQSVGYGPPPHPHEYEPVKEKALAGRRPSVPSRKASKDYASREYPSKDYDDRSRMPPPPRPKSARQERVVFRPPPPSNMRKAVDFHEDDEFDDFDDDDDSLLYDSVSRRASVEYGSGALPIRPRRQSIGQRSLEIDSDYDSDDLDSEPAPSRGRRNSFVNFEDKVRSASRYQEDVSGSTPPLTAEALRQVKNGGSSRSTRSSGSRDESEYKHSATTRTTRSGSGEDDITIKIPMGAVVEVGNTKIHCRDGGDISVGRPGTTRGSSDRANSTYGDDRKSRADRSATRTRASSQAESYTRVPPPLQPPRMPPLLNHGGYAPHSAHWDRYTNDYY
ncbi:hypothetical protein F4775DRAFT_199122 [Biscogniauxia sp. FL1348]|nr:hypothetical protein F4775DRAFT_199122 [Biscogniauxia sp. FL1348]